MNEQRIERVAIIGAGLMGFGIGVEYARFGYQVSLYNTSEASSKLAMARCREALDLMAETELITAGDAEAAYGRLRPTTDLVEAASGAQLVVESVFEVLSVKQEVFAKLDEICPPPAILATNTSRLLVSDIAQALKHPERVLATHYYQPPHLVPLVEVVGGQKTDPQLVEQVAGLLRGMRKKVAVPDVEVPAYIGNRIQAAIGREAQWLIDHGVCSPEVLDDVIQFGFGRRMPFTGYFKRLDLVGLDLRYRESKGHGTDLWKPIAERIERGDLGMKTGKGFYEWPGDTAEQLHRRMNLDLIRLLKRDMEEGSI